MKGKLIAKASATSRTNVPLATAYESRYEAITAHGLEAIAEDELERVCGSGILIHPESASGCISFEYRGDPSSLLKLKTVLAVYLVRQFAVPGPRALLGDMNFRRILDDIRVVRASFSANAFRTIYLSAAGANSPIMTRLKSTIAAETGLLAGHDNGDLQIRVRRCAYGSEGWDVLTRLSPRPLTARPWRVCHLQGGLDASVAHAMVLMTRPSLTDSFLNLCCGSGTILIERLTMMPAANVRGLDLSPDALVCANANIEASGFRSQVELLQCDIQSMPIPDSSVDVLCADLPFGFQIGSHGENKKLYGPMLTEAARVAKDDARFCLLTGEIKLMHEVIDRSVEWVLEHSIRVRTAGLIPGIFFLRRRLRGE